MDALSYCASESKEMGLSRVLQAEQSWLCSCGRVHPLLITR